MRKPLLLGLILFIATLVGLYQMRLLVLTAAFNTVLDKSDIRLLHLDGLVVGWYGLEIAELVLGVGEENTRQTVQQLYLEYSLADFRLRRLEVSRAILNLPAMGEPARPHVESQLALTGLVRQLLAVPLESISVAALEVVGMSIPQLSQPLQLHTNWNGPLFSLLIRNRDKQLQLQLQRSDPQQLLVTSELRDGDKTLFQLGMTASPRADQLWVQGEGRAVVGALIPSLAGLIDLPEFAGAVTGQVEFEMSALLNDKLSLSGEQEWKLVLLPATELEISLARAGAAPLAGELRLSVVTAPATNSQRKNAEQYRSVLHCNYVQTMHCNAVLALQLQAPEISIAGEQVTTVTGLDLQLSAHLQLDDKQLTATLAAGEVAYIDRLVQGELGVDQLALILDSKGIAHYQLDTGDLRLQIDRLQLWLPRLQTPLVKLATRLNLSDLKVSHDADKPLYGRVHVSSDSINMQSASTWLPALAVEADVSFVQQLVRVNGRVHSDERKPLFSLSAQHHLKTERGSGRVQIENLSFDADGNRLSQHFSHWPFNWDIYQGSVAMDVSASWRNGGEAAQIQGEISQWLEGLAGVYNDIGFTGLYGDLQADFTAPDQLFTPSAATMSLETLDLGVPITDLQARFQLDTARQQLTLQSAQAQLFGGRVWTQDAVYRAGESSNRLDIGVDGLQLEQLLALTGYEAVEGSGSLSGLLPVTITPTGVVMAGGMLAARAPGGVLRYRVGMDVGTDPSLQQVVNVLSNYQYNILQVEADYLQSGDLLLEMRLRGSNPDYDGGRPIHLNLNVTDNIPKLLESLQSARVIADTIERKLSSTR